MIELVLIGYFLVIVVLLFAIRDVVHKTNRLERWVLDIKEKIGNEKSVAKKTTKRKV